ncbi:MAG: PEP-CTERM sorting domain-containing protein [Fimbriimonadaceae bacterium]|nr:PEP-CTERM sorting domain-containing protein [Fimbriimonadaceae bacterium]QYK55358.1 MAG: PEP-CTERM sorting domain-containing protein [Fimbriimonadaceae bacterium]
MKKVTLIALAMVAVAANAQTYTIDDGTSENSIGLTAGGNLAWANQFDISGGNNVITTVDMTWGSPSFPGSSGVTAGQSFRWFVWTQNSGGTRWATGQITLVGQGVGTVAAGSIDTDRFQSVATGGVSVAGAFNNRFYVGVAINHSAGGFPGSLDQSGPNGNGLRSWVGGSGTANGFDPNNVGGGIGSFRMDEIGLPGAWLVRANAVPEPTTMVALGAGVAAFVARRRKK